MKSIPVLFLLTLFFLPVKAQKSKAEYIASIQPDTVKYWKLSKKERKNKLPLSSDFSNDELKFHKKLDLLNTVRIDTIYYLYTTYHEAENYDQHQLNLSRIRRFEKEFPQIFDNDMIRWKLIAQSGCESREVCDQFFHGFIISYKAPPRKADLKASVDHMKRVIAEYEEAYRIAEKMRDSIEIVHEKVGVRKAQPGDNIKDKAKGIRKDMDCRKFNYKGWLTTTLHLDDRGYIDSISFDREIDGCLDELKEALHENWRWSTTRVDRKRIPSRAEIRMKLPFRKKSLDLENYKLHYDLDALGEKYYANEKGVFRIDTIRHDDEIPDVDSTVIKVFQRNDWKRALVVTDVTGSMYPYIAQVVLWHHLHTKSDDISHFVFFNDGDLKPTSRKKPGETGGIYDVAGSSFEEVKDTLYKAMANGHGGDTPENNVEAVIKGLGKCESCEDIIMIADNYATPRDLSLFREITKPVKIILCGAEKGINVQYLNLAKKTGGSLHTIEEDITGLASMHAGERIKIGEQEFYINKKGFFTRVYGM